MAMVTWRGVSGAWTSGLSWRSFQQPGSLDSALFSATDSSTATLAGSAAIGDVAFAAGSQATLLLQGALTLAGTLDLAAGTLDLAAGGTIEGGTVDYAGGSVLAGGGVADGVVWLGALGDGLAITSATAAATQAATGGLDVAGALTLEGGAYAGAAFAVSTFATGSARIDAAAASVATLDSTTTIVASADDPSHSAQTAPADAGLTLGGAGSFVSNGLIVSDLASVLAPLTIDSAGFVNAGTLALNATIVADLQQTFTIYAGRFPTQVTLTFDATYAPGLLEDAAAFANTGTILGEAASIEVAGSSFVNSGSILLATAQAQEPFVTATQAYVQTTTLDSTIDIAAAVQSFTNSGTIEASVIRFDDNLSLAQLGSVVGNVLFTGTLDLGGGTLDAGRLDPTGSFTFTGTVRNGTLIRDGGILVTGGASLLGVAVLDQAPGVILDAESGSITLDAGTTELAYSTAAVVDQISVTAGAVGVIDLIGARAPGVLSFGLATTISDTVEGSTLEIGGLGTFSDSGSIILDGATLGIATLDGTGTIALADGAVLQIGALAGGNAVTVDFGAGSNLLSLPPDASGANAIGLTLNGLLAGDEIDLAGISSNPPIGSFGAAGAAVQGGMLDVQGASGQQASLAVGGDPAGLGFTVSSDPTGGTLVTVTCFLRGTRIATPQGEVPIERLRIGDLVLTASGRARPIKWLGRRSYSASVVAAQPQLRPVRFAASSLGPGVPRRALRVSPPHAMLLAAPGGGTVLIPAASLINDRTITRTAIRAVSYIHIELDTPDAVFAEGAATETFVDCESRGLFENAVEYTQLYPDDVAEGWQFCAPRVEGGWLLEAVRAGLPAAGRVTQRPGRALSWHIDHQGDGRIEGWVLDRAAPGDALEIDIVIQEQHLARCTANRYRVDLDHAGLRNGACGFCLDLPDIDQGLLAAAQVRERSTGAVLSR